MKCQPGSTEIVQTVFLLSEPGLKLQRLRF